MKYLERRGLIKTIYSLMMTDKHITDYESNQFDEIGLEIDPEGFNSYKEDVINECKAALSDSLNDPDYYDILQEYIDSLVCEVLSADVLTPRYVIWNLFAVAYNEETIDHEELRLIRHVSRTLEMSKTDYLELEQYMKTVIELRKERQMLESSSKPYSEIRPLVEEVEIRQKAIITSVTALIGDEAYEYQKRIQSIKPKEDSQIKKTFDSATSMVSDTAGKVASNVKTTMNEKVAPTANNIGNGIVKGFTKTTNAIGSALFGKSKKQDDKQEGQ